jgi:hypothetical protein
MRNPGEAKVLPAGLARDPDRITRFEREFGLRRACIVWLLQGS